MPRSTRLIKFSQPGTHTPVTSIQNKANAARAQIRPPSCPPSHSAPQAHERGGLACLRSCQWAFCADSSVSWVGSCVN